MKTKKRPVFVSESDYSKVTEQIKLMGVKWWSETEALYFHLPTAVMMVLAFIAVAVIIGSLNH